jgi:hypothetical protein
VDITNPYAPPASELKTALDPGAIWRREKLIVMRRGTDLPGRCILCNAAAEAGKSRRILYLNIWLQIALIALFVAFNLLALVPILILSMVFRKTARLAIPVCTLHRRKRLWMTLATVALLLVSISFGIFAARNPEYWNPVFMIAAVIFLAAFLLAIVRGQLLRAKKIDAEMLILKGAKSPFLDSLTEYPGP